MAVGSLTVLLQLSSGQPKSVARWQVLIFACRTVFVGTFLDTRIPFTGSECSQPLPCLLCASAPLHYSCAQQIEYSCDVCGGKGAEGNTATRCTMPAKLPEHLAVVVKRFELEWVDGKIEARKMLEKVTVPCYLEYAINTPQPLRDYDLSHCEGTAARPVRYGLYAAVLHSGNALEKGHYTMFGRDSAAADLGEKDIPRSPWR